MDFSQLTNAIKNTHDVLFVQASKSVNICLTLRNWLIGCRIQEYELNGSDRALYGENLIERLSEALQKSIPNCSARSLWDYLNFYKAYPEILQAVPAEFRSIINRSTGFQILQPVAAESSVFFDQIVGAGINLQVPREPAKTDIPRLPISTLVRALSFTHFVELIKINDPLKRSFYEIESVRGHWSRRELKRQIGSLYYERTGLSKNKEKLSKLVQQEAHQLTPKDVIRDPYVFEFLGIKPNEILRENNLRDSLLDKLQEFLLEMGKGFCFEARDKRILMGNEFYFVDLVCYHRILKCHVLIELKVEPFSHENIGQLNSYLSYYQKHEMTQGDNQPVGLLLCAEKNEALVEYALSGLSNQLFISQYQLALPNKDEIKNFIEKILREVAFQKESV